MTTAPIPTEPPESGWHALDTLTRLVVAVATVIAAVLLDGVVCLATLGLVAVLSMEAPVLAIDEPTTGLDRAGIDRIEAVLRDLHANGRTAIVASHDMRFVAETCQRVVVMGAGRVRLDGSPADVFAEPRWLLLHDAGLAPPEAARVGARLGLGSTPTESALVTALDLSR